MDYWVKILEMNIDAFSFEELGEMLPVVHLFVKFETVIKLIHFYFVRVETLQNLSKHPAVRKVTLWVRDFVGQVEGLDPEVKFSWQTGGVCVDG